MTSFALVLCLCSLSLTHAINSTSSDGSVTKVKSISRADVEERRKEISETLIREYDKIELPGEENEEVNVLYKDTLVVRKRQYTFDVAHSNEPCAFGPILDKDHKEIYYHVRDLIDSENTVYLNKTDEAKAEYPRELGWEHDIIVQTFQMNEKGEFQKDKNGTKILNTHKFALVRPVRFVRYTCEEGTFCCENRCCPLAIKNFWKKIKDGDKDYRMEVQIENETISLSLKPEPLGESNARDCAYFIESENLFGIQNPPVDPVRFQCPKNFYCCADTLCCKRLKPREPEQTFGGWLASFKSVFIGIFVACGLLFVAGLWYWCHYRRHTRPPPHTYIAPVQRQSSRMSRVSEASRT